MKPQPNTATIEPLSFQRRSPDPNYGLSYDEVQQRFAAGAHNAMPQGVTPSVGKIILKNTLTLFNGINLLLAIAILLVGRPENTLFFGIAICNTLMGIIQELRSKRTLDKLAVLAKSMVTAVRDGTCVSIDQEAVVLDDILIFTTGNQVCADAVVVFSEGCEVDESLLTGEADRIKKNIGDGVLSGSFVTAGRVWVQVAAVAEQSYATALTVAAKQEKKPKTPLMRTLNSIIRVLTIAIVPLGLLLFFNQYNSSQDLQASVLGASAAMIGMIPEGLILLTSVTLSVGALRLARKKALVQSLPSIETLACVDVLCLDKTGTITDGTLSFEELVVQPGHQRPQAADALRELMGALSDENATATALRGTFGGQRAWTALAQVPFSSARKWSGATFENAGSYVVGAPAFIFPDLQQQPFSPAIEEKTAKGLRVLCLAHSPQPFDGDALPAGFQCIALVVLSDTIRPEAPDTFRFFEKEGVVLKVISGDDAQTTSTIAAKAGISGAEKYVDMSTFSDDFDFSFIVEQYTVFGRVSPAQKQALVAALKQNGHTACMTGDGVNDVLAMKEANCSVAMIGGSDAARGACDFVLMSSDFSAMIEVLREGRKVINNIENVASLYLVKTIYSAILSLLYNFIPYPYPFAPLQMTPINALTVGIPSFFLALRGNYQRPEGKFLVNVLEHSVPAALTVVFNILVVQLIGIFFGLTQLETSTMIVLLTGSVGFFLLWEISPPRTWPIRLLIWGLAAAFGVCLFFFGHFFTLGTLFSRNIFFWLPLFYISARMQLFLNKVVCRIERYANEADPGDDTPKQLPS